MAAVAPNALAATDAVTVKAKRKAAKAEAAAEAEKRNLAEERNLADPAPALAAATTVTRKVTLAAPAIRKREP